MSRAGRCTVSAPARRRGARDVPPAEGLRGHRREPALSGLHHPRAALRVVVSEVCGEIESLRQKSIGVVRLHTPKGGDDTCSARIRPCELQSLDHQISANQASYSLKDGKSDLEYPSYFSIAACICLVAALGS